jgi:hypothetical protein
MWNLCELLINLCNVLYVNCLLISGVPSVNKNSICHAVCLVLSVVDWMVP